MKRVIPAVRRAVPAAAAALALALPATAGASHTYTHQFAQRMNAVCEAQFSGLSGGNCTVVTARCYGVYDVVLGTGARGPLRYVRCIGQVRATTNGFNARTCAWDGWIRPSDRRVFRDPADGPWVCRP